MLAENPQIIDIDIYQLQNIKNAFNPPPKKNIIFLIYEKDKILKFIHSEEGLLPPPLEWRGKETLKEIYKEKKVDKVFAIEKSCIREISANFQKKANYDQSYLKQAFTVLEAIIPFIGKSIHQYPEEIKKIKMLRYSLVKIIFNFFIPNNSTIILAIIGEEEVFASLILGIKNKEIYLITTTDSLVPSGLNIKGISSYEDVLNLTEKIFFKCGLGVFIPLIVFNNLKENENKLKYFFKGYKKKEIIFKPLTLKLKIILFLLSKILG